MKQRSAYIVFTRFSFGRRFLLGLLILSSAFTNNVCAQKVYDFNATCIQAYNEVNKLKIAPATALIAKAKQQNPQNLVPVLLDAYTDFYVLFLIRCTTIASAMSISTAPWYR